MKPCPTCGYLVPGAWTECRRCGATLPFASSAPPAPAPARSSTLLAPVEPVITFIPARSPARPSPAANGRNVAIAALSLAVVAAGVFSLIPHGGHRAKAAPAILAPLSAAAGIPTSLSAVVRIAAESSRHTALSTVMSVSGSSGAPVTVTQLATAQPSYQWVPGDQPSTTNTVISFTGAPGVDVIAVSGTSRDVCAFGRWTPATGPEYVTMAHVPACTANAAPATGWTQVAGGSAQDLPDASGR